MTIMSTAAMAQDDKFQQAYDLASEGVELYDNEQYKEAIKKYDASLKLYDKYAPAYYEKAMTLYQLDKDSEAKKVLLQSIKKCEEDEDIAMNYKLLGDITDDEGNPRKAIEYYEKAWELSSNDRPNEQQTIAYNMGVAYEGLAQVEKENADSLFAVAANCYFFSLKRNPQHPGSYYGLYEASIRCGSNPESWAYYTAFPVLGWYGFFGSGHSNIGKLGEMPEKWASLNLTEEELGQYGPLNRLIYESPRELAKTEPSEYGRLYDLYMYVVPKVAEKITDEPIPLSMDKKDFVDEAIWPLYSKMVREGVFETFCHVIAMRVEKDYIANANWLTKNEEAKQKLVDFLNEGRYFDPEIYNEQRWGKIPSVSGVESAEDAHARNEEAKLAFKYYITHYVGTEEMQHTAQFIISWSQASPDVNIPIGDAESKWLTEETFPYLVAYMAMCSGIQLESGSKELTEDEYANVVSAVLWYYDKNKEHTGENAELERLSGLDEETFAKEMKANYEAFKAGITETVK